MCSGEDYSCAINIVISILFGILIGILVFLGIITDVIPGVIVSLVIAFLIAVFLFVLIVIPRYVRCIIKSSCAIVIGLFGVIITSTIVLTIDITLPIALAILIGLIVFFLTITVIKLLKLLSCVIRYNDDNLSDTTTNLTDINTLTTTNLTDNTSEANCLGANQPVGYFRKF